ncbi:unnamed protein product, partial [Laminaria digitata]
RCSVRGVYHHAMVAVNSCRGCSASAMRFRLEAARATACLVLLLSVRCSALSSAAFSGTVRLAKTSSPHARGLGWLGHKNSAAIHGSSLPRTAKSRHRAYGNSNDYPNDNRNGIANNGVSYDDYSYDSYHDDNATATTDDNHYSGGGRNPQQGQGGDLDGNRGFADDDGMMDAGMGVDVGMDGAGTGGLESA